MGVLFLAFLTAAALLAPIFIPESATKQNLEYRLTEPTLSMSPYHYPLGSDNLGRDILTRIVYGARTSLKLGLLSVLVGGVLGALLGSVAGYYGGLVDEVLMRIADAQLSIPFVLLTITLVGALGPSERNIVIVLGVSSWVSYGRIVRSRVLTLREVEFVEAAKAIGATSGRILSRHLLPNVIPTLIVVASFELSNVILAEAALSFLGIGVPPPAPTWGNMLGDARDYLSVAPWFMTWPGMALTVTIMSINAISSWARDSLDPLTRVQ